MHIFFFFDCDSLAATCFFAIYLHAHTRIWYTRIFVVFKYCCYITRINPSRRRPLTRVRRQVALKRARISIRASIVGFTWPRRRRNGNLAADRTGSPGRTTTTVRRRPSVIDEKYPLSKWYVTKRHTYIARGTRAEYGNTTVFM